MAGVVLEFEPCRTERRRPRETPKNLKIQRQKRPTATILGDDIIQPSISTPPRRRRAAAGRLGAAQRRRARRRGRDLPPGAREREEEKDGDDDEDDDAARRRPGSSPGMTEMRRAGALRGEVEDYQPLRPDRARPFAREAIEAEKRGSGCPASSPTKFERGRRWRTCGCARGVSRGARIMVWVVYFFDFERTAMLPPRRTSRPSWTSGCDKGNGRYRNEERRNNDCSCCSQMREMARPETWRARPRPARGRQGVGQIVGVDRAGGREEQSRRSPRGRVAEIAGVDRAQRACLCHRGGRVVMCGGAGAKRAGSKRRAGARGLGAGARYPGTGARPAAASASAAQILPCWRRATPPARRCPTRMRRSRGQSRPRRVSAGAREIYDLNGRPRKFAALALRVICTGRRRRSWTEARAQCGGRRSSRTSESPPPRRGRCGDALARPRAGRLEGRGLPAESHRGRTGGAEHGSRAARVPGPVVELKVFFARRGAPARVPDAISRAAGGRWRRRHAG